MLRPQVVGGGDGNDRKALDWTELVLLQVYQLSLTGGADNGSTCAVPLKTPGHCGIANAFELGSRDCGHRLVGSIDDTDFFLLEPPRLKPRNLSKKP